MKRLGVKSGICLLASVGLLFAMTACQMGKKTEIDLTQYVKCTFEGYDGDGVMTYEFDYKGLMNDLEENKVKYEKSDVKDSVKLTPDKVDHLSNGDTVSFEMEVKNRLENNVKATFTFDNFEVTVSGLEERPAFDPFEYVDVKFTGIAPNGTISIENVGSSPISKVRYKIVSDNGGENLKNGDVVVIEATGRNGTDLKEVCAEAGYQLKADKKEYTVQGLDEYATSLSKITSTLVDELKKQGQDVFYSNTKWVDTEKVDSIECVGTYFTSLKEGNRASSSLPNNYIYIIYKVTVTNLNETLSYYYYVRFTNIVVKADGKNEIYDINSVAFPQGSNYGGDTVRSNGKKQNYFYVGYADIESLYNKVIRPTSQYYNCENNIQDTAAKTTTTETTTAETSADASATETTQATETT